MVDDALALLAGTRAEERVLFWDGVAERGDPEPPPGISCREQHGDDLGDRLAAAFAVLLERADRAAIFGTDCAALQDSDLEAVFQAMDASDVALAPARDGGFVAIGLRRAAPEIFRGVAWGTGVVLEQTRERARAAGLRVTEVGAALDDLDTPADLVRHLERQVGATPVRSPALDRALRHLGLLPPR